MAGRETHAEETTPRGDYFHAGASERPDDCKSFGRLGTSDEYSHAVCSRRWAVVRRRVLAERTAPRSYGTRKKCTRRVSRSRVAYTARGSRMVRSPTLPGFTKWNPSAGRSATGPG